MRNFYKFGKSKTVKNIVQEYKQGLNGELKDVRKRRNVAESIVREKSFKFALKVMGLYACLQKADERVISKQLLRSGTSIGANVEEALAAQTRKDFHSKMTIASKGARETRYWLRLLQESELVKVDVGECLRMVEELVKMLTAITKTTGRNIDEGRS